MSLLRRLLSIAVLAPAISAAQKPLVLAKPDAEHPEPFSQITGIRELRNGRVLVTDSRDKIVQFIDFKGGATKVGREGAGPGEYLTPNAIAALPGDSSAIWDGGSRRYLMVLPDGKLGREFRLEPPEGLSRAGYGAFASTLPRGVDARGNIYFQGSPFGRTAEGDPAPSDSVPVIRFDRAAQRAETVAFFHNATGNATVAAGPGGRGLNITNGAANPLLPRDEWVALSDGRVAVVRGETYRVDFYTARAVKTSGPPAPYEKFRVDDGVRALVLAERKRQIASGAPRSRPGGDASSVPPEILKQLLNLEPWPEVVPPFMMGAARARPNGQIWVLRTQRTEGASHLYDVFDGAGRVTGQVQLPPRTRLIGFGSGTVYLVRTDDDDLQYLQRYRLADDLPRR